MKLRKGQGSFAKNHMLATVLAIVIGMVVLYYIISSLGVLEGSSACRFPSLKRLLGQLADKSGASPCT